MAIERIKVSNFRSFKELDLELGPLTVLIGPNAAGKSNLVQLFRFLRDIARDGLENAISLQGGVEYVSNVKIGAEKDLAIEIVSGEEVSSGFRVIEGQTVREWRIVINKVIYRFALRFDEKTGRVKIAEDTLIRKANFFEETDDGVEKEAGSGEFTTSNLNTVIKTTATVNGKPLEGQMLEPFSDDTSQKFFPEALLLGHGSLFPPVAAYLFSPLGITGGLPLSIYDFNPKGIKTTAPVAGKSELEEDGSNLAIVLKKIMDNKEDRRTFLNLLKDMLSFAVDLAVERGFNNALRFKLKEKHSQTYLPEFLLSDGTISIAALIVALFFEDKPFILIEEPERHIHPYLISKLMSLLKDASSHKQIIITTQNPEIVKHAELEDLLLISRDKEGFSTVSHPAEKERVKRFLEHDLGIEELFIENLLGV